MTIIFNTFDFWNDVLTFSIGAIGLGIIAKFAKMAIMSLYDSDEEER